MNIILVLIILLAGTIATYCSGNRFARITAVLFSLASLVFSIALQIKGNLTYHLPWIESLGINLSLNLDPLSLAMILLTTILLPLILLTGTSKAYPNEKLFYSLVMFMAFAMVGSFLSSNAILYYVFWEISLIPIYFIVFLWGVGSHEEKLKAVTTFFVQTFAGSLFMLASLIYLYSIAQSFEISALIAAGRSLPLTNQIWVFLGFFLAYAIKTPIFPFHTWQADIYMRAPAVGSMLLAGIMSKMGAYSIIRWQLPITPFAAEELRPYILVLCIIGVVYGLLIALRQDNMKRFMAFGSLSHVSFIAAGAYSLTYAGLQGAIALILAHGLTVVGLFFAADIITCRTDKTNISELGGLSQKAGKFSFAFIVIVLAGISMPLSLNFVGEFNILVGLYSFSQNIFYPLFIGLSLILGAFVFLRMYQHVMLGPKTKLDFSDLSFKEGLIFTILIALLLIYGVYSTPISDFMKPVVQSILVSVR